MLCVSLTGLLFVGCLDILQLTEGAKFLLAAPTQPHYDQDYTVTVTALGIDQREKFRESVTLEFHLKDYPYTLVNKTKLFFDQDGVQTWSVVFSWAKMQELDARALVLMMMADRNYNEEKIDLVFSHMNGYIFIQTDKPVYTPRQTIKYRILAVDESLKLAKYPVKVDLKNHNDTVLDRMRFSAEDAFKKQEFKIPKETEPGNWSITATYEGQFSTIMTNTTVQFEVKEYVLPRFYSSVTVKPDVITLTDNWIRIQGDAKYVYGKAVYGRVEIQLGVWHETRGLELLNYKILTKRLDKGQFKKNIRTSRLFPEGTEMYKGCKLYVNVNITEDGTLETDRVEDTSAFIDDPYYVIDYDASKRFFKPGFPYDLKVKATTKSGRRASWAFMVIDVFLTGSNGREYKGESLDSKLEKDGADSFTINTPTDLLKMRFEINVFNMKKKTGKAEVTINKLETKSNNYIYISMKNEIKKYRDGSISLQYTPALPYDTVRMITVIVISKGHIVFTKATPCGVDGLSLVTLPRKLYTEVSPEMRIVAFYQADYRLAREEGNETVIDTLLVDTQDTCMEEIRVDKYCPRGSDCAGTTVFKPKADFPIRVRGGPNMKVGLVAVDEAVLLVNNKITLSRQSMFNQLGSHDQGTGYGHGKDVKELFKNSGLVTKEIDSIVEDVPTPRKSTRKRLETVDEILYDEALGIQGHEVNVAPNTVRKYFPETWMFDEHVLNDRGELILEHKLPDSITTWSFMAVGISADRGICVSKPSTQKVQQMFFADLRMPFKAVRLEEVKFRVAVYNFKRVNITVIGKISGSAGLCFPSNDADFAKENATHFRMNLARESAASLEFKLIPLRNGELTVRVDLQALEERDVQERKLFVVAEGRREKKSLTFVLDPEAKHVTYKKPKKGKLVLTNTDVVKNQFDIKQKTQFTKVNLAVPKEVIFGTESCSITAFGDLMGDIISHAVMQSKSLMDHPVLDAEEVLGDLAPTVHALLYADKIHLLDDRKKKRGHRFLKHGVTRLLNYRNNDYSFSLFKNSKPATWLTAFVLKTLCYTSKFTFVDKENLIDRGFAWLLAQGDEELNEQDWRLAEDSFEYRLMLSAEVLSALLECGFEKEPRIDLVYQTVMHLEENFEAIKIPMVLAKVTYALSKFARFEEPTDPSTPIVKSAVQKLLGMKRRNRHGQTYWSTDRDETNEPKKMPFWYKKGAKASSIEATAYALMVFLEHGGTNVDSIADWLVAQRNPNGAFIGAMDSAAAIQALSAYSLYNLQPTQQQQVSINLACNVTSGHRHDYKHFFQFTQNNVLTEEKLEDVPVGKVLEVLTQGSGLGQMQVNLEYNIPVDKNEECPFNMSDSHIEVKEIGQSSQANFDVESNPMCSFCNWNCPAIQPVPRRNMFSQRQRNRIADSLNLQRNRARRHRGRRALRQRGHRDLRNQPSASKKLICFRVCLQPIKGLFRKVPVTVEVEMISGFLPKMEDVEKMRDIPGFIGVEYNEEDQRLVVHIDKISDDGSTCVAFRALDSEEVGRPLPANIIVRQMDVRDPVCTEKYESPLNQQSLQVFCADSSNTNRGECSCYSGLCGECGPRRSLSLRDTKALGCNAEIGYQLQMKRGKVFLTNQWYEIEATVLSVNKSGSHALSPGNTVRLITPGSCACPVQGYSGHFEEPFYLLSSDVTKLMDRNGEAKFRYLLDHNTNIVRVTEAGESSHASGRPALDNYLLSRAYPPNDQC